MKTLGDMLVVGNHDLKLTKALTVISCHLHPAYDALSETLAGYSKETCLFTSLAVREFLVGIGYHDATVRPCALIVRRYGRDGKELWSVGLGVPGEDTLPGKFNGHAVVTVPSINLLIDTTLYQLARRQHMSALPGMVACTYVNEPVPNKTNKNRRLPGLAKINMVAGTDDNIRFALYWGDRPEINLKRELDWREPLQQARRRAIARALTDAYDQTLTSSDSARSATS